MTRNTLGDMHNLLMEQMERLADASDEEIKAEIARAEAMTDVAEQVTANAANMLKAAHLRTRMPAGGELPAVLGGGWGGVSRRRTPEQDAWLAERYPDPSASLDELCAEFEARFGAPMSRQRLMEWASRRKVRRAGGGFWTDEMHEFMRECIPGRTEAEIAAAFEERFGIALTRSQVKNEKYRLGVRSGTFGGRFEPGNVPANKGRPIEEWMPSDASRAAVAAGRFKKGQMPVSARGIPVGSGRVDRQGYTWVKVAERPSLKEGGCGRTNNNWRAKHVVVWEEAHGRPAPPRSMIVFADGDKSNFDPDNLVAVPRPLWAAISRCRIPYGDRETLEVAMDVARAKSAIQAARKRPRRCASCGEEFSPRYARQRRCDACLGREPEQKGD